MTSPTITDRWKPARRTDNDVDVYCAPACGRGCTYAEYQTAVIEAFECAKALGRQWSPQVHENLGWYWQVRTGEPGRGVVVWKAHGTHAAMFLAGIESGHENGFRWSADGPSPQAAIGAVVRKAQAEIDRLTQAIEPLLASISVADWIGSKPDDNA